MEKKTEKRIELTPEQMDKVSGSIGFRNGGLSRIKKGPPAQRMAEPGDVYADSFRGSV